MTAHPYNSHQALPFSKWPIDEREAWLSAKARGSVFDGRGPAASWSPHTQKKVELTVGRFLKWLLVVKGVDLPGMPLNINEGTLRAYLGFLRLRVSPVSVHMYIKDLCRYCRVSWPEADRSVLNTLERNLRWRATPSRNKSAKIVDLRALVNMGHDLLVSGRAQIETHPVRGAVLVRDGLAISLLALRPQRIRAFGSLQIGRELKQIGDKWHILIPPELSKTKQHWDGPFPDSLQADLEYYLDIARPKLLTHQSRKRKTKERTKAQAELWVGRDGQPLHYKRLAKVIANRTTKHFGNRIGPHMFRDCAATFVAIHSGGEVGILKSILGHSTMKTAERHYIQASQIEASRKFEEAVHPVRRKRQQHSRKNIL